MPNLESNSADSNREKEPTAWDVLGIQEGEPLDKIRVAYHEAVKKTHPDAGGTQKDFERIQGAYEKLTEGLKGKKPNGSRVDPMVEKTVNLYKEAMERNHRNSAVEPQGGPDPDDPDQSLDFYK